MTFTPIFKGFGGMLAAALILALPLFSQETSNDVVVVALAGPEGPGGLAIELNVVKAGQFAVFALGTSAELPNAAKDPRLTLEDSTGTVIDSVDDWGDHSSRSAVIKAFDDFGVWLEAPEAAMVVRLTAGIYTVKVTNKGFVWGTVRAGVTSWNESAGPDVGGNIPSTGIAPGLYEGRGPGFYGCLYVSSDSLRLTSRGSRCFQDDDNDRDDPESFNVEYDNVLTGPCGDDDGNLNWDFDVPINSDGTFKIVNSFASFWASINIEATGRFSTTGKSVSGEFRKTLGGSTCVADFDMTHVGN